MYTVHYTLYSVYNVYTSYAQCTFGMHMNGTTKKKNSLEPIARLWYWKSSYLIHCVLILCYTIRSFIVVLLNRIRIQKCTNSSNTHRTDTYIVQTHIVQTNIVNMNISKKRSIDRNNRKLCVCITRTVLYSLYSP